MNEVLNRIADALFPSSEERVRNVKFFRGYASSVTADELAGQLEAANAQISDGRATVIDSVDHYQPPSRS